MISRASVAVLLTVALTAVQATSNIPVVFVHGFLGGGPDEILTSGSFPYASEFEDEGFTVMRGSVGPVSSNWDRACELYAQIRGLQVDYGAAHSAAAGHNRFGKSYVGEALYDSWSESNPLHFVGHSMGGQTIRLLEILMREGAAEEIAAPGATSELFTGGKDWIKTVTTFSTPHDGTTLVEVLGSGFVNLIRDIIVFFAGFFDGSGLDSLYDFDLEHWGLVRGPGESADDYWERLAETVLDDDNTDLAPFDLSPAGAQVMNQRGEQAYDSTYYFAFASEDTYRIYACFWFFRCGYVENPELSMNLLLQPFAYQLGNLDRPEILRKNDGVVPWSAQKCPTLGTSNGQANCLEFSGTWNPGTWYYVDVNYLDHLGTNSEDWFRDTFSYSTSAKKLYRDHAQRIRELDVPAYTAAGFTAPIEVGNAAGLLEPQVEPSNAGAILLICVGSVLGLAAIGVAVKLRSARKANNVSTFRGSFSSFGSRKGSVTVPSPKATPKSKKSSIQGSRQYSAPAPSVVKSNPMQNYSVDLETAPTL